MSADSPRRNLLAGGSGGGLSGHAVGGGGAGGIGISGGLQRGLAVPAIVPPQTISDRSILDSAIGFINDVTLVHQPVTDPKDTITWARFETCADVSDPRFGDDWELEGNAAPPLLLILGYGLGVQVWAIPANGEAVEVLSWRHGVVTALRVLPTPATGAALDGNGRADEPVDAFTEKRPLVALVDGGSAAASALISGVAGGMGGGGSGGSLGSAASAAAQFSAVNFVSLKTGLQVKTIKFKNAVLDILANRTAVAITFHERIAVFDARTLEDRLTITTCYPSPGINPNPIALGPRWLAYAEHKLLHSKRSGGGCDGEGVPSYTATVLNAAKSFSKGLRELGEQVAAGLTGTTAGSANSSKSSSFDSASGGSDVKQSGVVTIIDVKHPIKDYSPTTGTPLSAATTHAGGGDPIVAHFVAHSEALVAMELDSSGMLLLTADRRGHDFHVFRIQPHPVGSSLAAVQHLYVLHRGDTSAKVQHIAFSLDSRWVAVSTLRGTTHVFPITPYGGAMGVRTHTSLHVVNKLSRFHRSAGLGADGRSSSPISHSESTTFVQSLQPYHNPTLPPFPRPSVVQPLAQLRQPFALGSPPGSATLGSGGLSVGGGSGGGSSSQRQRLSSLSDDSGKPLSVCAIFAKSRSWLLEPPTATREAPHRVQRKAVDSLFVMAGHGALIQYDLDTKLASNVAKEKICDDTPIELEVEAKAQWNLGRRKDGSQEIIPPLALDNWLIKDRHASLLLDSAHHFDEPDERAESWLAQVEIITHAGPHRRLWMGPQFVFKNYNTPSGSNLNHVDTEAVEIGVTKANTTTLPSASNATQLGSNANSSLSSAASAERSSPLNMPLSAAAAANATGHSRGGVPVLIESGSYSSIEQSPKLMDRFRHGHLDSDYGHGDTRLKEDLADAMRESPSTAAARRETGGPCIRQLAGAASETASDASHNHTTAAGAGAHLATATTTKSTAIDNAYYYDALAEHVDDGDAEENQHTHTDEQSAPTGEVASNMLPLDALHLGKRLPAGHMGGTDAAAISALASALPNICSYDPMGQPGAAKIEKIVNPLGTVTTVTAGLVAEMQADMLDEVVGQLAAEDCVIHENCDEALFRPVVAIFCDDLAEQRKHEKLQLQQGKQDGQMLTSEQQQQLQQATDEAAPPVVLANKLIVPVIAKEVDEVLTQKEKQKSHHGKLKSQAAAAAAQQQQREEEEASHAQKFAELSHLNRPSNKANVTPTLTNKTADKTTKTAAKTRPSSCASATTSEDDREATEDELQATTAPATTAVKATKKSKAAKHKANNKTVATNTTTTTTAGAMERSSASSNLSDSEASVEVFGESSAKKSNNKKDKKSVEKIESKTEKKAEEAEEPELQLEITKKKESMDIKLDEEIKLEEQALKDKQLAMEKNTVKPKELPKQAEQKPEKQQPNDELDDEDDHADSLLANKTSIASVMVSSASLQGLSLHVETSADEQTVEEPKQPEQQPEPSKKVLAAAAEPRNKTMTIDKKTEKSTSAAPAAAVKEFIALPIEKEAEPKTKATTKADSNKLTKDSKAKEAETSAKVYSVKVIEETVDAAKPQKPLKAAPIKLSTSTPSVWKTVSSGTDSLAKSSSTGSTNAESVANASDYPSLAASPGRKPNKVEALPACLPVPLKPAELKGPAAKSSSASPAKKAGTPKKNNRNTTAVPYCDFDFLPMLEALPPLPALEPLEVLDKTVKGKESQQQLQMVEPNEDEEQAQERREERSLINFESPLQENVALPRGLSGQNLIFALCGSLHYENEYTQLTASKKTTPEDEAEEPTTPETPPLGRAKAAQPTSQLTPHKYTSTSNNSSGSEEIIVMEEPKKLSKKHKRAKQQREQQQRELLQQQQQQPAPDDEELRPLISMSDSQLELDISPALAASVGGDGSLPEDLLHFGSSGCISLPVCSPSLAQSSTTDSEGALPTTTSDDNGVYVTHLGHGSSSTNSSTPHKLKTKKLEHKINLIAAIEAATSSSTSSAEESSVETGSPSVVLNADNNSTAGAADSHAGSIDIMLGSTSSSSAGGAAGGAGSGAASVALPLSGNAAVAGNVTSVGVGVGVGVGVSSSQPSATKKKTKRRKR